MRTRNGRDNPEDKQLKRAYAASAGSLFIPLGYRIGYGVRWIDAGGLAGKTEASTKSGPCRTMRRSTKGVVFLTSLLLALGGTKAAAGGEVWAWGKNSDGQCGKVTNLSTSNPNPPLRLDGMSGTIAIVGGERHTLALKADGTVWAWGNNSYRQLAANGINFSSVPVQVGSLTDILAIAAGSRHNLALKKDGTVWAWGANEHGQLGSAATVSEEVPSQVSGLTEVMAISAGWAHSLALKRDGTVWAWGQNYYGQLGNSTNIGTEAANAVPALAAPGMIAIAAGGGHSLALSTKGEVWAWGNNQWGQLGNRQPGIRGNVHDPVPPPLRVEGLSEVMAIAAGSEAGVSHSLALKKDGTVWGWGANSYGQLGAPRLADRNSAPVQIAGMNAATAIAAGAYHTLALKTNSTIWAWGWNESGELGTGTNLPTVNPIPAPVSGPSGVSAIGAGAHHSLAVSGGAEQAPVINAGGIVDAASYREWLAPGSIASIFGSNLASDTKAAGAVPLPTQLLDTRVTFNGIAAPLFFVSPAQVNVQVPFEMANSATVAVTRNTSSSPPRTIAVQTAAPSIFSQPRTEIGAVIHAATSGIVTPGSPSNPGEFISIFCTGICFVGGVASGQASPPREVPIKPVVAIGGLRALVTWAGLAPGFVGVNQINVQVPANTPLGLAPLTIASDAFTSNVVMLPVALRELTPEHLY